MGLIRGCRIQRKTTANKQKNMGLSQMSCPRQLIHYQTAVQLPLTREDTVYLPCALGLLKLGGAAPVSPKLSGGEGCDISK